MDIFTAAAFTAFLQVVAIDLVLAGDNAVVIGMAAAGLRPDQRKKAILVGILAATVLRILFASVAVYLLNIIGLLLAGGLLLLWVCWKMWTEIRATHAARDADVSSGDGASRTGFRKTFFQAASQIVIADVSMSLDNVLAVAGAAREHPAVLVVGLGLSIAMMGLAANFIARLLNRHHWIAYVGLLIIVYVAFNMIFHGTLEVWPNLPLPSAT